MKCLSLWQPWASLVVRGMKRCETRSWPTPYRGPIVIHAAKKWDRELLSIALREPFRSALNPIPGAYPQPRVGVDFRLPLGAIVGVAYLHGCSVMTERNIAAVDAISRYERAFGHYEPGRYRWDLSNAIAFDDPIPLRGRQQLFTMNDDVCRRVADAMIANTGETIEEWTARAEWIPDDERKS